MSVIAVFDPFGPAPNSTSIDAFLADWDRLPRTEAGSSYVYALRDAAGSVFYIGKGLGNRAHDVEGHRHGRLGYYLAEFLSGTYTVDLLRTGLSPDDAELLESQLIETFGPQLVNWEGNLGTIFTEASVAQLHEGAEGLRARACAAAEHRLEEAVSLCGEALANLSKWEQTKHETEVHELESLAATSLAARVDLRRAQRDYVPQAPVLACECLSDLTRYLCALGRAEEARREVDAFTERYPRGSFRDYEFYDHRYARNVQIAVTKREQATLRRIERGLGSAGGRVTTKAVRRNPKA